ncbi:Nuf2 family-domain-containing protein [Morchella snyderi]|nr:Nuf2 family-domain-containing protein [Morchella snyderi]
MSYNPRQSNVFRSSQNQPPPSTRKQTTQQADSYLMIAESTIVDCISELGVTFSLDDLKRPTPQKTQLVFEMFAELLMGVRRETVEPIIRSASEQLDHPETLHEPSALMAFYASLRTLLQECDIHDFTFNDLAKPDTKRLIKIFSYVINFTRFREGRAGEIGEHLAKAEKIRDAIEARAQENEELAARVEALRARRAREEPLIEGVRRDVEALTEELRGMSKREKALSAEYGRLRKDKEAYIKTLEDRAFFVTRTRQEAEKIRPYIVDSPEKLQGVIVDMGATLAAEKAEAEALERRARALQTSADSFAVVEADVMAAIKIMEECEAELVKEEESARKAARHFDVLTQKQTEVREAERSEQRLQRQLQNATDKIARARESGESKSASAQKKMRELKEAYKQLARERAERDKDMEKKKIIIEKIEKEMADMKEKVEEEVGAAHAEFAKMKGHILLYISEMEQSI